MQQYLELMNYIHKSGRLKSDRTGTGTKSVFGYQMRFNLIKNFPLLTTKKLHIRSILHELLWFINGDTNIKYLNDNNVRIWDDWANEQGDLGPVYGKMWREWPDNEGGTIDQITELMDNLKNKPFSRRHIISAYNPAILPKEGRSHSENVSNGKQALPPCHTLFQFNVQEATIEERLHYLNNNKTSLSHLEKLMNKQEISDLLTFINKNIVSDSDEALLVEYIQEVIQKVKKTGKDVTNFDILEHFIFENFCNTVINREHILAYKWIEKNLDFEEFQIDYYDNLVNKFLTNILSFYKIPEHLLDCQLYQRSADVFLGVPFNIASYSFLVYMVAHQLDMIPNDFIWTGGDCHIYQNHFNQTKLQSKRKPLELPQLVIKRKPDSIFDYVFDDFEIINYKFHPHIKGDISV